MLAHPELLMRVVTNLLTNAIRYRRPDIPCRIEISATTDGELVTVRVADNGQGIPPSERHRVFEMSRRLHGGDTPGLGFGLAVCHRIVESHGGSIEAEASEPPGATITFTLLDATGHHPAPTT